MRKIRQTKRPKKDKVIAFRLDSELYEMLEAEASKLITDPDSRRSADVAVRKIVRMYFDGELIKREPKR